MAIQMTSTSYRPSVELEERLSILKEIASIAYNIGNKKLCTQAIDAHNQLASQYNAQANTKKKGFWGQFLDNLAFTTTSVLTIDLIDESSIRYNRHSSFPQDFQVAILNDLLQKLNR